LWDNKIGRRICEVPGRGIGDANMFLPWIVKYLSCKELEAARTGGHLLCHWGSLGAAVSYIIGCFMDFYMTYRRQRSYIGLIRYLFC
jgi:hypothetical protein